MVRVTYCLVIALNCYAGVSGAYVGERTWLEATDEGFVTRTEMAEIRPGEIAAPTHYDVPPEVIWHHREEYNTYHYGAEIGNRRRHILTGAVVNSKTQLFRVLGTGTPEWETWWLEEFEKIFPVYADNVDVCAAVYFDFMNGKSKLCRYSSASKEPLWTFTPPSGESLHVPPEVPRDGAFIAAASSAGSAHATLRVFEPENGTVIDSVTITESPSYVAGDLAVTPDGRIILFPVAYDLYVYEFDGRSLTYRDKIKTADIKRTHAISHDGEFVAYRNYNDIVVYRFREGKYSLLFKYPNPDFNCYSMVFDSEGRLYAGWLYITYKKPRITCHDCRSGSPTPIWVYTYREEAGKYQDLVIDLAVSDNGSRLIAASLGNDSNENPEIELFNGLTGEYLFGVDTPGSMFCCDITPDGVYATAAGKNVHANIMSYGGDIYCIKVLDDIPVNGPDAFAARPSGDAVRVSWRGSWDKLAGFNLYRAEASAAGDDSRLKLNAELIKGRSPYLFVDEDVQPGGQYRYWLEAVDLSGARETFGPAEVRLPTKPAAFVLYQNAPNPTRGKTTFAFSLAAAGSAELAVYDLAGRKVWRHEDTYAEGANKLEATFDLAPGVYVYRLQAGAKAAVEKMVVVK
jgi:hypothetical protein